MIDQRKCGRAIFLWPGLSEPRHILAILARAGFTPDAVDRDHFSWTWVDTLSGTFHLAGLRLRKEHLPGAPPSHPIVIQRSNPSLARPVESDLSRLPRGCRLETLFSQEGLRHRLRAARNGQELEVAVMRTRFADPAGVGVSPWFPLVEVGWATESLEPQRLAAFLRDRLGWQTLPPDWVRIGLAVLALPDPGAAAPIGAAVDDLAPTLERQAEIFLGKQVSRIQSNREGAIWDLDPEFVHDVRVATRRARFALRILGEHFGPARTAPLRAELRWLANACGAVRDLDMLRIHLAEAGPTLEAAPLTLNDLVAHVATARRRALSRMRGALRSRRFQNLVEQLGRIISAGLRSLEPNPREPGREHPVAETTADFSAPLALRLARRHVGRALNRVVRAGRQAVVQRDPVELHRLRILFKRLRYTCEFFLPWIEGAFRPLLPRLVAVQDCLGAHQDTRCAKALYAEMRRSLRDAGGDSGEMHFLLGGVEENLRHRGQSLRESFLPLWTPFPGILKRFLDNLARCSAEGRQPPLPAPPVGERPWLSALLAAGPSPPPPEGAGAAKNRELVNAPGSYRLLPHTADLALKVRGNTLAELLQAAVRGCRRLLVAGSPGKTPLSFPVVLEGKDPAEILWRLLNEALFLFDTQSFVPSEIRIHSATAERLEGDLLGERLDPERHAVVHAVKAATLHDLRIRKERGGLAVRIVFDV